MAYNPYYEYPPTAPAPGGNAPGQQPPPYPGVLPATHSAHRQMPMPHSAGQNPIINSQPTKGKGYPPPYFKEQGGRRYYVNQQPPSDLESPYPLVTSFGQPIAQPMPSGSGGGDAVGQSMEQDVPPPPPGLDYLAHLDRVYVTQKREFLEAVLGCETYKDYTIKDFQGRDLFSAKEEGTDSCSRFCWGSIRPFQLTIKDLSTQQEVMRVSRPFACGCCVLPDCLQKIYIYAPPGQLAGTVEQLWSICNTPTFVVKDSQGFEELKIEGPCCQYPLSAGSVVFNLIKGGMPVGNISTKWRGLFRYVCSCTIQNNFRITFPTDMDVRMKAVLLGACFLIDFMAYEV